jgi:hypothetical protein
MRRHEGLTRTHPSSQICRRIARALGGDLTAESEGLGKGCIMTFTVPLCVPEPAEAAAAAAAAALPPLQTEEERDNSRSLGSPAEVLEPPASHLPHAPPPPPPPSPASSAAASPPGSPSLLPMAVARSGATTTAAADVSILVAEDDALSQAVMRKVLSRLGLRCTLVGDGAAAVEAYRTGVMRHVLVVARKR